jgi:hypothetical protein
MTEETKMLDPPGGATKRRGRGAGWGGSHGTQGDDGDENDPLSDDFKRLARMLARISASLGKLINNDHGIIDPELRAQFVRTWPQAANNLAQAIRRLLEESIRVQSALDEPRKLRRQLERAGLTGPMLRMKETSLNFYLDPIDRIVDLPLTGKESLGQKVVNNLLTWTKPAFKVMNSILGSLLKAFPGMEVVKELKEHVEASYEVAGALEEERE